MAAFINGAAKIEVAGGGAALDTATRRQRAGLDQQCFGERGLPCRAVSDPALFPEAAPPRRVLIDSFGAGGNFLAAVLEAAA